jgi:hypothetical protein
VVRSSPAAFPGLCGVDALRQDRPPEIPHREKMTHREDARSCSAEHVARHAPLAQNALWNNVRLIPTKIDHRVVLTSPSAWFRNRGVWMI